MDRYAYRPSDVDGAAGSRRPFFRFLPTILAVHRATSVLDIGFAIANTVLGVALGMVTAVVLACWRITTPSVAPPLPASVRPVGWRSPEE